MTARTPKSSEIILPASIPAKDREILYHRKKELEAKRLEMVNGLPHLYGWKWYRWAKEWHDSYNKMKLLVAANQISKSSTQIRTVIDWATDERHWPYISNRRPRLFWYLYPTQDVIKTEIDTKWIPEFLPRNEYKDHPMYGWQIERSSKAVEGIHFNSGVYLQFKTYAQGAKVLQTSTIDYVACFVAGTLVLTKSGLRPVEGIKEGDWVYSQKGLRRVTRVLSRSVEVIEAIFTNGERIVGTPEHPFFTYNRGWVPLSDLTVEDQIATVPVWKLIKKLYYLKERCTSVTQRVTTCVSEIILGAAEITKVSSFMSLFGKSTTPKKSPRVLSSTTRTSILWTIGFKIWSCLHERSTLESTRSMSGSQLKSGNLSAKTRNVELNLNPAPQKGLPQDTVLKNVVESLKSALAWLVKPFIKLSRTQLKDFVHPPAQTNISFIYNLTVEDEPSYFANGLLVHNCDEELPENLYDELRARLIATDGIFSMVFTATLGQEMWWRAMEARGEQELFKDALKMNVSMYDCLYYHDGSRSHWTEERIEKIKRSCKSKNEVLKRVYGRFVKDEGKKYPTFNPERHYIQPKEIPTSYRLYAGVDIGSGGGEGHPAAIIWLAVSPDNKVGYVVDGWRGDTQVTTNGDILEKFRSMKYSAPLNKYTLVNQAYDTQSKDFFVISTRAGEPFVPAKKNQEQGEDMINTLLKCGMLYIFDTDELRKLGSEMMSLLSMTAKTKAKDDFIDALRFAVMAVPWDWTAIEEGTDNPPDDEEHAVMKENAEQKRRSTLSEAELLALEIRERRGEDTSEPTGDSWGVDAEIEEWNSYYG